MRGRVKAQTTRVFESPFDSQFKWASLTASSKDCDYMTERASVTLAQVIRSHFVANEQDQIVLGLILTI